jgi:hypothetical protein
MTFKLKIKRIYILSLWDLTNCASHNNLYVALKYQYFLYFLCVVSSLCVFLFCQNNYLLILRELTIAHKCIRQQSSRVRIRILTTFRQKRKAYNKPRTRNIKNVYILMLHKDYYGLYSLWDLTSLIYVYFILSFKVMYLNACWWSVRPKPVAYIDETINICCGWLHHVCQFWYNTPQRDDFHKENPYYWLVEPPSHFMVFQFFVVNQHYRQRLVSWLYLG